jgi:hypothetical protein
VRYWTVFDLIVVMRLRALDRHDTSTEESDMRVLAIILLLLGALFVDLGATVGDHSPAFAGMILACAAVMLWNRGRKPGVLKSPELADLERRLHDLEARIAPVQDEIAAAHADIAVLKADQWFFKELYSGRIATEVQPKERSGEIG